MIGREATCKESLQVGNTAKMREALSDACYAMFNFLKTQNGGYEEMAKALDKAKATLAAPPRNCDLHKSEPEAYQAYLTAMKNATKKTYVYFEPWLFAEAKGAKE